MGWVVGGEIIQTRRRQAPSSGDLSSAMWVENGPRRDEKDGQGRLPEDQTLAREAPLVFALKGIGTILESGARKEELGRGRGMGGV